MIKDKLQQQETYDTVKSVHERVSRTVSKCAEYIKVYPRFGDMVAKTTVEVIAGFEKEFGKVSIFFRTVQALNLILNKFPNANKQSKMASKTQLIKNCEKDPCRLNAVILEWLTAEAKKGV